MMGRLSGLAAGQARQRARELLETFELDLQVPGFHHFGNLDGVKDCVSPGPLPKMHCVP
jgi:hypothetical protein